MDNHCKDCSYAKKTTTPSGSSKEPPKARNVSAFYNARTAYWKQNPYTTAYYQVGQ